MLFLTDCRKGLFDPQIEIKKQGDLLVFVSNIFNCCHVTNASNLKSKSFVIQNYESSHTFLNDNKVCCKSGVYCSTGTFSIDKQDKTKSFEKTHSLFTQSVQNNTLENNLKDETDEKLILALYTNSPPRKRPRYKCYKTTLDSLHD